VARWPDHDEAVRRAAAELVAQGFAQERPQKHRGRLLEWEGHVIDARINLPNEFPWVPPEVFLDRVALPRRIPHVESNGKLCLVRAGSLLDGGNPEGLVLDALDRARAVVRRGLEGSNDGDFVTEFIAYWDDGADYDAWSICDLMRSAGPLYTGQLEDSLVSDTRLLVADEATSGGAWASRLGRRLSNAGAAYYLPLASPLSPPEFGERLHLASFCEILEKHASSAAFGALKSWLKSAPLPARLLISMPVPTPSSPKTAFMVTLPSVSEAELRITRRGWREGKGPTEREIGLRRHRRLLRGRVRRADAAYLLPRTGETAGMLTKRVTIIGCGAIGSHLAGLLAAAGVGRLELVDKEMLARENVHRHALGIDSVGQYKASALARALQQRFPHLEIVGRDEDVVDTLHTSPAPLEEASLVVVAVGDETLQLKLDSRLQPHVRRLHVWLEPLGIAQHALLTAMPGTRGCFGCVLGRDGAGALHNTASLAAAGQELARTIAGCQDAFFPFSGIDAVHAAVLAAEMVIAALNEAAPEAQLVTRVGSLDRFTASGLKLSDRAHRLRPGETRVGDFGRRDCPICGPSH